MATKAIAAANPFTQLVPKGAVAPPISSGSSSPYFIMLHNGQNTYASMVQKLKVKENGTPVYVDGEEMKVMNPLKFIQTPTYFQCFAVHNSDGSLTEIQPAEGRCPDGKKDTIFGIALLVDEKYNIFPARYRLQGPRAKGFKDAIQYVLAECENPDWGSRSKDHKMTVGSGLPTFCYGFHELQIETRNPKDTSKGQKPYEVTSVISNPTPGLVLRALREAMGDEKFTATLQACIGDYNNEVPKL